MMCHVARECITYSTHSGSARMFADAFQIPRYPTYMHALFFVVSTLRLRSFA